MSILKGLTPEIINSITRGMRPVLRDEMRNLLSGRITRIPEGLESEFAVELRGLAQDIGVGGFGTVSSVVGELAGMIEGGLIVGKATQIVDSISDLITEQKDQWARERASEVMARDINAHPERFARLPQVGTSAEIARDVEKFIKDREKSSKKEGKVPDDRTIQFGDPIKRGRPVSSGFEDVPLLIDIEPEEEEKDRPIKRVPPFLPPKIEFPGKNGRRPYIPPQSRPNTLDEDIINVSIARSLGFQKQQIPQRTVILPDDTKSYNYIEFTRIANANSLYQDNIFNTSF